MKKKNTSFAVSEEAAEFISEQVESGRYGSASEVMRAGLRLLQEKELKLEALRTQLKIGRTSGNPRPYDHEVILKTARAMKADSVG